MVSIREPVSLIQRYSISSPTLSVFLPIDGKYIFVFVNKEPVSLIHRYSIPSPSLSVFLPIDGKY
jgi:hypothetical protein